MTDKKHPMGDPIPGRFFAFVETTTVVKHHTLIVEAQDEEAAEKIVDDMEKEELPHMMTFSESRAIRVKPIREGHVGR